MKATKYLFEISLICKLDNSWHGVKVLAKNIDQAVKLAILDMANLLYVETTDLQFEPKHSAVYLNPISVESDIQQDEVFYGLDASKVPQRIYTMR